MLNNETTPTVRLEYKGHIYRFRPEHHIETPEGDTFYLKYAEALKHPGDFSSRLIDFFASDANIDIVHPCFVVR